MTDRITTVDQGAEFLGRVGGFHDGFIKELTVTSRDSFTINGSKPQDVSQVCTGEFDVRIVFAQHPVVTDQAPARTIARCIFKRVTDIFMDLRQLRGFEWPLDDVRIEPCVPNGGLQLSCRWKRLSPENEWQDHSQCLFSFKELEVLALRDG